MSRFPDVEEKSGYLELKGDGPKKLLLLLNEYPSWREDKLEERYYKEVGASFKASGSNFRTLIIQFLEYGLVKETKEKTGYRFKLNPTVWGLETELFQLINVLTYYWLETGDKTLRSDATLKAVLKKVSQKVEETRYGNINPQKYNYISAFIAAQIRDFSSDHSRTKYPYADRSPDVIKKAQKSLSKKQAQPLPAMTVTKEVSDQGSLFDKPSNSAQPKVQTETVSGSFILPDTGLQSDTPIGLPKGAVHILNADKFWPGVFAKMKGEMLNPDLFQGKNAVIFSHYVSASRKQRTIICLIKKRAKVYFLIYSICGALNDSTDLHGVISSIELDPAGIQPQVLNIDGDPFFAVVSYLPITESVRFFDKVAAVRNLADELEAKFWMVDEF